jgi:UDP-N-acetylmuramyl pentapeptide phosphotransferase/UDP-N-acetylglucosamine-1-phosphate transferase
MTGAGRSLRHRGATGAGRLLLAVAAGALARGALSGIARTGGAPALDRVNHRGEPVSLAAVPAFALAASATAGAGAVVEGEYGLAAASVVAGLGSGAVGLYDDIVGARPDQKADKGFRGHLAALRQGRVSAGLVKVAGVGAAGLAAAALLPPRGRGRSGLGRAVDVVLGAGVIAGTANLYNLLDLRPGRAIKAGLIVGVPLAGTRAGGAAAGAVGAAAGLLPDDLGERVMLGDSGANSLGALLGVALAARTGRAGRAGLLAGLVALTAASEKVSFTKVIERTPVLRELDALGRRPAAVRAPAVVVAPRTEATGTAVTPDGPGQPA